MKITVELNDIKEEEYDFVNDKGFRCQGVSRYALASGGFKFKFKSAEDIEEIKSAGDNCLCSVDKYGRLRLIKSEEN